MINTNIYIIILNLFMFLLSCSEPLSLKEREAARVEWLKAHSTEDYLPDNFQEIKYLLLNKPVKEDFSFLNEIPELRSLTIKLNGNGNFSNFSKLSKLTQLILIDATDENLIGVSNLTNLERLFLTKCKFSSLNELKKNKNLKQLLIFESIIPFIELSKLDTIEELSINIGNMKLDDIKILSKNKNLKILKLSSNILTDEDYKEISKIFKNCYIENIKTIKH